MYSPATGLPKHPVASSFVPFHVLFRPPHCTEREKSNLYGSTVDQLSLKPQYQPIHSLHCYLYISYGTGRRICLNIKSSFLWWSHLLFFMACMFQHEGMISGGEITIYMIVAIGSPRIIQDLNSTTLKRTCFPQFKVIYH